MASTKSKQTNGAGKKQPKASTPSTGSSTPVAAAAAPAATFVASQVQIELTVYGSGKPEKSVYDAEQNKIKTEIEVLQARLVSYSSGFLGAGRSFI